MGQNARLTGEQAARHGGAQYLERQVDTTFVHPVANRKMFRTALSIAALPNTAAGTFAHGISNLDLSVPVRLKGWATTGSLGSDLALTPDVSVFTIDATNVNIVTGADLSGSSAFVEIEYARVGF